MKHLVGRLIGIGIGVWLTAAVLHSPVPAKADVPAPRSYIQGEGVKQSDGSTVYSSDKYGRVQVFSNVDKATLESWVRAIEQAALTLAALKGPTSLGMLYPVLEAMKNDHRKVAENEILKFAERWSSEIFDVWRGRGKYANYTPEQRSAEEKTINGRLYKVDDIRRMLQDSFEGSLKDFLSLAKQMTRVLDAFGPGYAIVEYPELTYPDQQRPFLTETVRKSFLGNVDITARRFKELQRGYEASHKGYFNMSPNWMKGTHWREKSKYLNPDELSWVDIIKLARAIEKSPVPLRPLFRRALWRMLFDPSLYPEDWRLPYRLPKQPPKAVDGVEIDRKPAFTKRSSLLASVDLLAPMATPRQGETGGFSVGDSSRVNPAFDGALGRTPGLTGSESSSLGRADSRATIDIASPDQSAWVKGDGAASGERVGGGISTAEQAAGVSDRDKAAQGSGGSQSSEQGNQGTGEQIEQLGASSGELDQKKGDKEGERSGGDGKSERDKFREAYEGPPEDNNNCIGVCGNGYTNPFDDYDGDGRGSLNLRSNSGLFVWVEDLLLVLSRAQQVQHMAILDLLAGLGGGRAGQQNAGRSEGSLLAAFRSFLSGVLGPVFGGEDSHKGALRVIDWASDWGDGGGFGGGDGPADPPSGGVDLIANEVTEDGKEVGPVGPPAKFDRAGFESGRRGTTPQVTKRIGAYKDRVRNNTVGTPNLSTQAPTTTQKIDRSAISRQTTEIGSNSPTLQTRAPADVKLSNPTDTTPVVQSPTSKAGYSE